MFNGAVKNIKIGVITGEPVRILWGALYYFIAAVLLFSGISKIIDPLPMIETMKAAFKLNDNLLLLAATILPVIEIALGLMLVLKIQTNRTFLVITALFFSFLVFSVYGTVIKLNTDCGCFGNTINSNFGWLMILRNIILLIFVLICMKPISYIKNKL
jgi:hypothetical protein